MKIQLQTNVAFSCMDLSHKTSQDGNLRRHELVAKTSRRN